MEKKIVILKKKMGIVGVSERIVEDESILSLTNEDNLKDKLLKKEEITYIQKLITNMIQEIINSKEGTNILCNTMEDLKQITSKEDIIKLIRNLISNYKEVLRNTKNNNEQFENLNNKLIKKIEKYLEVNTELVISIVIKNIIYNYFSTKLSLMNKLQIKNLETKEMSFSVNVDDLFNLINESFPKKSKENGVYNLSVTIFYNVLDQILSNEKKHMCWNNCKNAYVSKCPKIADQIKKPIGEYEFIIDGYQVLDEKGKVDKFIVEKCKKYQKAKPKVHTKEELDKIKKAREGLRTYWFDATTLEEAQIIQAELEHKGHIKGGRGKKISYDHAMSLKARRRKKI